MTNPPGQSGHPEFPQQQPPQGVYPGQVDPATGQPAFAQPQPGFYTEQTPGMTQIPEPPQRRRTGLIIGAIVAVLVLIGGGITLWAVNRTSSAGTAQSREAAQEFFTAVSKNDLVGILDRVHPGEAKLFRDAMEQSIVETKRLGLYKPDADPMKIPNDTFKVEGIEFDGDPQQVNDHLAIHKIRKGKITIRENVDQASAQYTEKFQELLRKMNQLSPAPLGQDNVIDFEEIAKKAGQPGSLATVKVNDKWYSSLFYSVADNILRDQKKTWPEKGITAKGADSPDQAVRELVTAAIDGNVTRVIELMPPQEMAVLHDLGPVLVDGTKTGGQADFTLVELETTTTKVPGGTRVSPRKVVVESQGERMIFERQNDCVRIAIPAQPAKQLCTKDLPMLMQLGASQQGVPLPPAVISLAQRMANSLLGIGVVATEDSGKYYVSPFNTMLEFGMMFLRDLQPADIDELIKLGG